MLQVIHSVYTIKADASVFIIPNQLSKLDDFFTATKPRAEFIHNTSVKAADSDEIICGNPNDLLVQLWWDSEDLGSENLARHGFTIQDGSEMQYFCNDYMEYLPLNLFKGHKEGDWIDFTFEWYNQDKTAILLLLHTRLDQLNYRYRSFGGFDELLAKLEKHHYGE